MKKFKLHLEKSMKDAFNPENELEYFEFFRQFDNCFIEYSDKELRVLDTNGKIIFESTTDSNYIGNNDVSYVMSLLELKDGGDYLITLKDGHKIVFGLPAQFIRDMLEKSGGIPITFGSVDMNGFIISYNGELP